MNLPACISVVIPSYNRYEMLAVTLPSYLRSELVKEVIVVDDCSAEQAWAKLQTYARSEPRIKLIRNPVNLGAPASRNRGIDEAQESLLLLSEDDLELGEGFFEMLAAHMQANQADIIAGRRLWMRVGESKAEAIARGKKTHKPVVDSRWLDHYSNVITPDDVQIPLLDGTMLMRREVCDQVRYYEPFGGPSTWREESDFQLTALQKGFRLIFCPHACCFHHSRSSVSFGTSRLKGNFRYLYRIYYNNRLFLERHRNFLRQNYPQALLMDSPLITSLFYTLRRVVWLGRVESLRWYASRAHKVFEWK